MGVCFRFARTVAVGDNSVMMHWQAEKSAVAKLSVLSNTSLVVFKLVIGAVTGSVSVLSEAIHSAVDLVAAVIALVAVRTSGKPADEGHPYGHGKVENISGVVEALLIFGAAAWIIMEAVQKFAHHEPLESVGWGVGVMLFSTVVNMVVSQRLFAVGRKTDSSALLADAWHLRTDVFTSLGVMVGLGVMMVGKKLWPDTDLSWVDPVAAIMVACLILKAAFDVTLSAGKDLLDVRLPAEEEKQITGIVEGTAPVIKGLHKLRTRKAGHVRYVDVHIQVDPGMTVDAAHVLTHQVATRIRESFPETVTTVHVEPWRTVPAPLKQ
jgi:cation diffusion facilitator family transporter